jgi:hypothetical protein
VQRWVEAVPDDGDSRSRWGSIIEQGMQLDAGLEAALTPGAAQPPVVDAFWAHGVRLSDATVASTVDGQWRDQRRERLELRGRPA